MKKNILLLAILATVAALPARAEEPAVEAALEAEAPTGILTEAEAELQDIQIAVEGTQVHVTGAEGYVLEVFNLTGVRVSQTKIESDDAVINLNLQHGCYILKVGKVVRKISIR